MEGLVTQKRARKIMRKNGASLQKLANTTGTTKNEVRKLFRTTARNLSQGGVTVSDTKALRRALSGGPAAGIAKTPRSKARARKTVTTIRKKSRRAS